MCIRDRLIADGHVAVNGKVITEMGVQVDESADVVTVDGKVCKIQEEKHYLAYNKPKMCIRDRQTP